MLSGQETDVSWLFFAESVGAAAKAGEGLGKVEPVIMFAAVAAQTGGHGRLASFGPRWLDGVGTARAMAGFAADLTQIMGKGEHFLPCLGGGTGDVAGETLHIELLPLCLQSVIGCGMLSAAPFCKLRGMTAGAGGAADVISRRPFLLLDGAF